MSKIKQGSMYLYFYYSIDVTVLDKDYFMAISHSLLFLVIKLGSIHFSLLLMTNENNSYTYTMTMKHQRCKPSAGNGLQVLCTTSLVHTINKSQTRCMNQVLGDHY